MPQLQIFLSEDNKITLDLTDERVSIGRLADNTQQIEDASVSSHHAEIFLENDTYHLHDVGSTNGTFINGEQVTDAVLKNGDEVRFGRVEAVFASEEEKGESQPMPESQAATAAAGSQSARPASFVSTSPVPKNPKVKDNIAAALYAVTALAVVAIGATTYFVLTMQAGS